MTLLTVLAPGLIMLSPLYLYKPELNQKTECYQPGSDSSLEKIL